MGTPPPSRSAPNRSSGHALCKSVRGPRAALLVAAGRSCRRSVDEDDVDAAMVWLEVGLEPLLLFLVPLLSGCRRLLLLRLRLLRLLLLLLL